MVSCPEFRNEAREGGCDTAGLFYVGQLSLTETEEIQGI